ncbi:hypothetical protein [Marinilabilia rubra]|uniref:hypothetical protein n=1 Tax=Marinilabilia rubra TaxID=2162893 RepID=UPI0018E09396|nr:hypothetical protein [Marinilabilia rubra]
MMKNLVFSVLLICLFFFSSTINGQDDGSQADEEWIEMGIIDSGGNVSKTGSSTWKNPLENSDLNGSQSGAETKVYIEQMGHNNNIDWEQKGQNNWIHLRQNGNGNVISGYLIGDENVIDIRQRGKGNFVGQELMYDGQEIQITQSGMNHVFIQKSDAVSIPNYKIHQQGNHGMTVIVEHDQQY